MARVLVLRTAGTNCDEETAWAFRLAGATVESIHVGQLVAGERRLAEFDILAVPGGFSYGDDLGAGTVLANRLRTRLRDDLDEFVAADKLVIGICNGFQVLVRLGILPGGDGDARGASLIGNVSAKFEDRWTDLRVETNRCPFLPGYSGVAGDGEAVGDGASAAGLVLRSPVAHREGRFVLRDPDALERLRERGQIALVYCRPPRDGEDGPQAAGGEYPANPNGSIADIAGVTNERGNVLGLMPHPERFVHALQDPHWTRRAEGVRDMAPETLERAGDGFAIFSRAVRFVDDTSARIR